MKSIALALACLVPAAPACSVYKTVVSQERVVDVERVPAQAIPAEGRESRGGVTVVRRDGVRMSWPDGAHVARTRDGLIVVPGGERPIAAFADDDVGAVELDHARYRKVQHRVRDEAGSAALTTLAVVSAIIVTVAGAVAIDDALSGIGDGLGAGIGHGPGISW